MDRWFPRVALVTHALGGGVWAWTGFLERVLRDSGRYAPEVLVVATSARDAASVRLLAPATWLGGCRMQTARVETTSYTHVGAFLTEFEFQRYQPRPALTDRLNQFDLVQVVAGTPAWANVARLARPPVCLAVATTAERERRSLLEQSTGPLRLWRGAMKAITGRIERQALGQVARVFAESEYTRAALAGSTAPSRLFVKPVGVDVDFFSPAPAYCTDGYLLAVGRFTDPRKNVRLLFAAYQQLRQRLPRAPKLVVVGRSGVTPADWSYAQSLGLGGCVEVRSDVTAQELRRLYQGAALFVLSSDEEGLGIVLLEAMASGLPIVSTDCGGPATAIRHKKTGYLTPIGDAAEFANTIGELLGQPELRAQMGRAGRAAAEAHFSLNVAGGAYIDAYDQLLGVNQP